MPCRMFSVCSTTSPGETDLLCVGYRGWHSNPVVCVCVPFLHSRSHIGKAILSQPACVSKLLSLLLDQRPSPKLVLIILQLCRAALPLMSVEDCGNVALPSWSYSINTLDTEQQDANDPASRIAALLLAKLADYVVPGRSPACLLRNPQLSDATKRFCGDWS